MTWDWISAIPFWPTQLSDHAARIDTILVAFVLVTIAFVLPVFIGMTWFAIKYRRGSKADRTGRPSGNVLVETSWALIPLAIMLFFFYQAAVAYFGLYDDDPDALQVDAVGKQWMWKFQHATGKRQINQLNVPVDTPVEITMISQDVIHSLFLPALRIKHDVLPDRYTHLRFTASQTGTYHLTCAEYCGTAHARMGGTLVVMEKAAYRDWVRRPDTFTDPVAAGRRLFADKGCRGCHGAEGAAAGRAPSLDNLWGTPVALADGGVVEADEDYLRRSMVRPNAQVVAGYDPIMPSFQGQLSEEEVRHLIAYIQTLTDERGRSR